MTIVKENSGEEPKAANNEKPAEQESEKKEEVFSQENIASPTKISHSEVAKALGVGNNDVDKEIIITPAEKKAFIDSVIDNSRFELEYSLFGGKLSITIRSLTSEESHALSAWAIKDGTRHPESRMSGSYRKFILTAQVSRYNGIYIPPLEHPLFETLESDGKTIKKPAWVDKCKFWDDKGAGVVQAVVQCLKDFDGKYAVLCNKAEDENFWRPDTP